MATERVSGMEGSEHALESRRGRSAPETRWSACRDVHRNDRGESMSSCCCSVAACGTSQNVITNPSSEAGCWFGAVFDEEENSTPAWALRLASGRLLCLDAAAASPRPSSSSSFHAHMAW